MRNYKILLKITVMIAKYSINVQKYIKITEKSIIMRYKIRLNVNIVKKCKLTLNRT